MRVAAIIVGAGAGTRFGGLKQYEKLNGRPVISYSINAFAEHGGVDLVVPVIGFGHERLFEEAMLSVSNVHKVAPYVIGGHDRYHSCGNGLMAVAAYGSPDMILIHDAVRPLASMQLIDAVLDARVGEGVIPVIGIHDSVKMILEGHSNDHAKVQTLHRSRLLLAQTPQSFCFSTMLRAREGVSQLDGEPFLDDAEIFEKVGAPLRFVYGEQLNIKITTAADAALAELIFMNPQLIGKTKEFT